MTNAVVAARINQVFSDLTVRERRRRASFFFNNRPHGHKTQSMTKRQVTLEDLQNHPQLLEKGVKEGDEVTFNEEGFPVDDEDAGTDGGDGSGEQVIREITTEDLEKYPALGNAGATVGQNWGFDSKNGEPIFPATEVDEPVKREITAEDLEKYPSLAQNGFKEGDQGDFDKNGEPVFSLAD